MRGEYVLQTTPDAKLVHGFKRDVTVEEVRAAAEDGSIEQMMNYVPVEKGDLFYIEAGTVHAIGAGALVAEIQENSNITYRLYDYNRVGKDGKKRELHVEKALKVMNLSASTFSKNEEREIVHGAGYESERLKQCRYFTIDHITCKNMVMIKQDERCFHALLFIEGDAVINADGPRITVKKGETVFVPAGSCELKVYGEFDVLDIFC